MKLRRRKYLLPGEIRRDHPAARAFLAPQRDHEKQPMPTKKEGK